MNAAHMKAQSPDQASGDARRLLNELESLLERQVRLARRGDLATVATLMQETDAVVAQVARFGVHETPEFERRRGTLGRLFDTLSLVLTTARGDVGDEIKRIRKGQKVLATYRRNLVQT